MEPQHRVLSYPVADGCRKALIFLAVLIFIVFLQSCRNFRLGEPAVIRMAGSDTMVELGRRWATEYMDRNTSVSIYISGGGTGTGFKKLASGEADIVMASRNIQSNEVQDLARRYGTIGIAHLVAKDALSIYLNRENPVNNLSLNQLQQIFSGKIRRWNELQPEVSDSVLVILRPATSGTQWYFRQVVLKDAGYIEDAAIAPTTNEVIRFIRSQSFGIGYGGIGYGRDVKHCLINGIAPTVENVQNDRYPLVRYLYLYTSDMPKGEVKKFIDWIMQADGQQIVRESGYIALWPAS